jgi:hypothetical protein
VCVRQREGHREGERDNVRADVKTHHITHKKEIDRQPDRDGKAKLNAYTSCHILTERHNINGGQEGSNRAIPQQVLVLLLKLA